MVAGQCDGAARIDGVGFSARALRIYAHKLVVGLCAGVYVALEEFRLPSANDGFQRFARQCTVRVSFWGAKRPAFLVSTNFDDMFAGRQVQGDLFLGVDPPNIVPVDIDAEVATRANKDVLASDDDCSVAVLCFAVGELAVSGHRRKLAELVDADDLYQGQAARQRQTGQAESAQQCAAFESGHFAIRKSGKTSFDGTGIRPKKSGFYGRRAFCRKPLS